MMLMFGHDLAIIDVETTGINSLYERVIELAIIRVSKNKIVDKYTTLINPQKHISPFISMFTGITNEQLTDAPLFGDVKDRVTKLLEGAVFVAHNVRFDYSFIKSELRRTGIRYKSKTFCTVRLSRRLYPDFKSHSLESIIKRFDFNYVNRHRAYDDAFVLWQFLKEVKKTKPKHVLTKAWTDLTRSLYSANIKIRTQVDALPEAPGAYTFYNKKDQVLYVGKSKNISDRVIAHFSADTKSTKHLTLLKEVSRIGHIITTGEFGAMLLEAQLIKELCPAYNSLLKKRKAFVVLIKYFDDDGLMTLKAETVNSLGEINAEDLLGVFKNKRSLREYLSSFAEKYKLCQKLLGIDHGRGACFAYKLGKCGGVCAGKEKKQIYNSRFLIAFVESRQFRPWPYSGQIEIIEKSEEEGKWESYVVDQWRLVSKKNSLGEVTKYENVFDPDYYKIIYRYLKHNPHNVQSLSD